MPTWAEGEDAAADPIVPPGGEDVPAVEAGPPPVPAPFGHAEALEVIGVLLLSCVHAYVLAFAPPPAGFVLEHLVAASALFVGIATVLWAVLLRDPGWRPPVPRGAVWLWEIAVGFVIAGAMFCAIHVGSRVLTAVGIPTGPPGWSEAYRVLWQDPTLRDFRPVELLCAVGYEEVVFRAYLMHRLGQLLGPASWWVVALPAALFALKHGFTLHHTLLAFLFGLAFGLIYRWTHRLPRLVAAHWFYDFVLRPA